MARILLIDDDADFAEDLQNRLRQQGHEVRWLELAEDGLKLLGSADNIDLVLLDNRMPGMSGLEFLAAQKQSQSKVRPPVILMTAAHNDRTAIQATNLDAHAYVIKPAEEKDFGELERVLQEALEITRRPKPVPIPRCDRDDDESVIVGRSKAILEVLMRAGRCAQLDETVLILGETGTGKDLVAQAIHTNSARQHGPFVVMDCTVPYGDLLGSELFGHEKNAFSGADKLRKGRFEHAHGGTLFLDEIGELPLLTQATLLRVLENREIVRVGGNDIIKVDVRVVAATHRDLKCMVREGKFREDLFYRLEGMTIPLPPLRDRKEDVELLARRFLARISGSASLLTLHPDALQRLRAYHWPGNIRQLQKVLCRAAGVCRGAQIMADELDLGEPSSEPPVPPLEGDEDAGLRRFIEQAWNQHPGDLWPFLQEQLERELLRFALSQPNLSQVQLARRLGMARNTLRTRIEQYGLQPPPS